MQTSLALSSAAIGVGCYVAGHNQIHEVHPSTATECLLYDMMLPSATSGTAILALLRVTGGYLWIMSLGFGPGDIYYLPDGGRTARAVTDCHCVNFIAGSGDTVSFLDWEPSGLASLWVTHPPFTETREVWAPALTLTQLAADPDDPSHVVMVGGGGNDPNCPVGADIYYVDLDALPGTPPRNLTADDTPQSGPQIRGDRVAFSDFGVLPGNPTCAQGVPPALDRVVVSSLMSGGRTLVRQGDGVTPLLLGLHAIYVLLYSPSGVAMIQLP